MSMTVYERLGMHVIQQVTITLIFLFVNAFEIAGLIVLTLLVKE